MMEAQDARLPMHRICSLTVTLLVALPASAVEIDWVRVGSPGNACDPQADGCFGAVRHRYRIAKYEVTNAQYVEFLNAVARLDPNELYSPHMTSSTYGGITRTGIPGLYLYDTISGREDVAVNYVSFYDGLRFANWLHNGQPSGFQDASTTEDGAYTITPEGIDDNSIVRNSGATFFVPSEHEWYKAAYYDPLSASFLAYPAGSDSPTVCTAPTAATNSANCDAVGSDNFDPDIDDLTIVGSFPGSASPFGTFDQGGNAIEWNETPFDFNHRGLRGGGFYLRLEFLAAAKRSASFAEAGSFDLGLRVAAIPEPGTALLVGGGLLLLAGRAQRPARRTRTSSARPLDPPPARSRTRTSPTRSTRPAAARRWQVDCTRSPASAPVTSTSRRSTTTSPAAC